MKIHCPKCQQTPPTDQINVSTDLAFCPACSEAFVISDTRNLSHVDEDYIFDPPKGAWFKDDAGKIVIGATTRSIAGAIFLVPFTVVWAGGSIGGIYGTQIASGQFSLLMSLFGIPFLIGSIAMITTTLLTLCGRYEVRIDAQDSAVFLGVGAIGWTRRFDWAGVTTIKEGECRSENSNTNTGGIIIDGKRRIRFGSGLNETRRGYMLSVMQYFKVGG